MTIQERIQNGEFENKIPYPPRQMKGTIEFFERTQKMHLYNQGEREARERFKEALEKEYGTTSYPKKDKIWDKAWGDGHSEGLERVADIYEELVDLIQF